MRKDKTMVVMKLWGIADTRFKATDVIGDLFDSKKELKDYLDGDVSLEKNLCTVELLSNFEGRSDVIRITTRNKSETYFCAIDKDGYAIYKPDKSKSRGKAIWDFEYGSKREIYSEFRNRGAHIENDVYAKNDTYWDKVSQMIKKNRLFSSKK